MTICDHVRDGLDSQELKIQKILPYSSPKQVARLCSVGALGGHDENLLQTVGV